ncbi:HD-GYP domain-containing protein [Cytobacillus spongiae]|jgi:putative nucleotidyltransferase with HDIG domain|uniref:HD-GYP domain-containing protein n=1 Tax=Cytobacillus spongiae TaxID=2901381 RepID=UPI001F16E4DF|nr:HD-GYP domain-containing protein [Cytobacillus spongiae]UII56144.1 HD-GYP domain-containing protein [Cytobacillus spongiae]
MTINLFFSKNDSFFIFFILIVIFWGIGFYQLPIWLLIIGATIIVLLRLYLLSDASLSFTEFFVHLFVYQLILFLSVWLMRHYRKALLSNLDLVVALANALDSRDPYTLDHSKNVSRLSVEMGKKMGLSAKQCEEIRIGALLHDIGKIGIREKILLKTEKLDASEYEQIKQHTLIGYNIIKHIKVFSNNSVLDSVLYHHERYDGKGYPKGLCGERIPLSARIIAIADTYDAMTSKRIYRDKLSIEHTLEEIKNNKGRQFDPEIADVFISLFNK